MRIGIFVVALAAMAMLIGGSATAATTNVANWAELVALSPASGDTVTFNAATYFVAAGGGQVELVGGVTYQGVDGTIIDGEGTSRAFTAWGDRAQNDALPYDDPLIDTDDHPANTSGPTGWTIEGMTIQNCVTQGADRVVERVGDPLFPTHTENVILNPDSNRDGGALLMQNSASGTVQDCTFTGNSTAPWVVEGDEGDDGGAISIAFGSLTVTDCLFDNNWAMSATSELQGVANNDADGDAGHIKMQGNTVSADDPTGTTVTVTRCIFRNGNAEDDAGACQNAARGGAMIFDSCLFEGNKSFNNGGVYQGGNNNARESRFTNCLFINNVSSDVASPNRMVSLKRNTSVINCTFVDNYISDQDIIYQNGNTVDIDGDGVNDETASLVQVTNCIFLNNSCGADGSNDHVLGSRNTSFTIASTNNLFFGNTGWTANTQRPENETGTIELDPTLDAEHKPLTGSPAINAGTTDGAPTVDYDGTARDATPDIGAFEADGGVAEGEGEGAVEGEGEGDVGPPFRTEGAPVAGMLGLGLVAAACALGGSAFLRKKD